MYNFLLFLFFIHSYSVFHIYDWQFVIDVLSIFIFSFLFSSRHVCILMMPDDWIDINMDRDSLSSTTNCWLCSNGCAVGRNKYIKSVFLIFFFRGEKMKKLWMHWATETLCLKLLISFCYSWFWFARRQFACASITSTDRFIYCTIDVIPLHTIHANEYFYDFFFLFFSVSLFCWSNNETNQTIKRIGTSER